MSPLYADRFAGHLELDDPRTPVTGAGGCVWPTIPAHRYLLKSTNATGFLAVLNTIGILVEKVTPGPAHDNCQYLMIAGPVPITFCIVWKRYNVETLGYTWDVGISASPCGLITFEVERPEEKCNRDPILGAHTCPLLPGSSTGSTFQMFQVEWDQTEPPPPPE